VIRTKRVERLPLQVISTLNQYNMEIGILNARKKASLTHGLQTRIILSMKELTMTNLLTRHHGSVLEFEYRWCVAELLDNISLRSSDADP